MLTLRLGILCLASGILFHHLDAQAGFDTALAAFQAKDYPKAMTEAKEAATAGDVRANFLLGVMYQGGLGTAASSSEAATWYDKAARGGVVGAFSKLSQLYARGDGVPKSAEKAIAYARQSAKLGDPEGMFFLYIQLRANALGYLDANGKADATKYQQLSARSIEERGLDFEAQDALYQSAEKGYPLAMLTLAAAFGGTVGDGNTDRMLGLTAKVPQHAYKAVHEYEKVARYMKNLGTSLASPQLFMDAQLSQVPAAMIKTCGLADSKDGTKPPMPTLVTTSVATPLSGAVWLPSKVPGYDRAYLVKGDWDEDWTFKGCDRTTTLRVRFSADGMGGARMSSTLKGSEFLGLAK